MDSLFGTLVLAGFLYWAYSTGKSIGSRKGYNVGFSRGRRNNHRRRRR